MAIVAICLFVVLVCALAFASARSGRPADGCCAPADPARDLRMRGAFDERDS
jgi:hypothetical protein